jgi:hypothetical protein
MKKFAKLTKNELVLGLLILAIIEGIFALILI